MSVGLKVAVGGLGAVGAKVAQMLDQGIDGLTLCTVSARDPERARAQTAGFRSPPDVLPLERLAEHADVVVECLPPELFAAVAKPILEKGGTLVPASVGALLLQYEELISLAAGHGGRIVVPSGAVVGLDGLRAAAQAGLEEVRLTTSKPPSSFGARVPFEGISIPAADIVQPLRLFAGSAREAIRLFPVNVNVAAAVSLAGLGPDRTLVEIWADPNLDRNQHQLEVRCADMRLSASAMNLPDPQNPRSSSITGYSIVAALRRIVEPLSIGS